MDSINELFHQISNTKYNLVPYEAKKTPFTPQELLTFAKAQHTWLQTQTPTEQIIAILVREITPRILERYSLVAKDLNQKIFLITDTFYPRFQEGNLNIIYIFENFCYEAGYYYVNTDTMPVQLVISWDRCLFFLANYPQLFETAWIIEDDVAFKKGVLPRFFAKFDNTIDFIAAEHDVDEHWHLWGTLRDCNLPQRGASYNPLIRISRKFITTLATFVKENRRLYFLEAFFLSFVIAKQLTYKLFDDLKSHFRYAPAITEIIHTEYSIYHPVKDDVLWDKIWHSDS